MSGDQWFALATGALVIVALLGGALVGSYIVRKANKS